MSSEIAALEELKGRCLAININYPDTGIRMRPAIECFTKHLGEAVKRPLKQHEVTEIAEEILDLRLYFQDIMNEYPEVKKDFLPAIKVCNYLVEPINKPD